MILIEKILALTFVVFLSVLVLFLGVTVKSVPVFVLANVCVKNS
ncbi:hypothetical protein VEA_004480 [Vibrio antiquarius]|uniref:Uncharacterized protein n=1 Tax=Vibrio antiquarius (strain Ex25) TaxID=150340 RepID=A0ACA6QQU5_VIBAE|nr:hypothetical protein VEA_004480 [Vibrio antiquarius]